MKDVVFWDVTPCGFSKNRRSVGLYRHDIQGEKFREQRTALVVLATKAGCEISSHRDLVASYYQRFS
jgi:hypothetical protein